MSTSIHSSLKLLSNSSSVTLHKCPRKFEIYRMLGKQVDEQGDEHLDFGSAVGEGMQEYLVSGSYEKAVMKVFRSWKKDLDDDQGAKSKKLFWHAVFAMQKFVEFRQTVLAQYEVAYFDGKPAIELGFSIDIGDGFFYRGFLDALLIHKITRQLKVLECKTTKFRNVHEASYANSGQGLGYSLVVDAIANILQLDAGASYEVIYPVYKTLAYEWEPFFFTKSHTQRALWIKNIIRDIQHIAEYAADNHFPMHGESCFDFFRPCEYFGVCEISSKVLFAGVKELEVKAVDPKYQFNFTLDQIIEAQLAL
jgi:hypothetical protein